MKYNFKVGDVLTFYFNSEYVNLEVTSTDSVTEKGVEFYGIGTSKFWMWFSADNNGRLVDTIHGVGLGVNFIVT